MGLLHGSEGRVVDILIVVNDNGQLLAIAESKQAGIKGFE